MTTNENPPVAAGGLKRNGAQGCASVQVNYSTCLAVRKRGRTCIIAKLVWAQPLNELVLAAPYRTRQPVNVVSLPPQMLDFARRQGARLWLVRLDRAGECYALPLADVERVAWLHCSEAQPEWFISLERFQRISWQEWPYVEQVLVLDNQSEPAQLSLFSAVSI